MKRGQDGFTLVELLVVVVIMGIVIVPMTEAIIVSLKTTDQTNQRLSESHDAQMTAAFFSNDVQSAITVTSGAAADACSAASIVKFDWTDTSGAARSARYVLATVGSERRLTRYACSGGTLVSSFPVVHYVGPANPTVTLTGSCTSVNPGAQSVTLGVVDVSGYQYSLTGTRRVC